MADPYKTIREFCARFTKTYVRMEWLELLDSAVTYSGPGQPHKGNLVFFYRHMHFLTSLAYRLAQYPHLLKKHKRNK